MDLHLSERAAAFEGRLALGPCPNAVKECSDKMAGLVYRAQRRRRATQQRGRRFLKVEKPQVLEDPFEAWADGRAPETALRDEWASRWLRTHAAEALHPIAEVPPVGGEAVERYRGLLKHEAAVIFQARTEKIGLKAFLHRRQVPGYPTPMCACATGKETAEHVVLHCRSLVDERHKLRRSLAPRLLETRDDFAAATNNLRSARLIA